MSFFKKLLPANIYERARQFILFSADDPNNLWQVLPQRKTKTNVTIPRIQGFRYPSPGSRPQPSIPSVESEDTVYNSGFLGRDPRNLPKDDVFAFNSTKAPRQIENNYIQKLGSPGQKNPAVAAYDPEGLRSTMTANWPALQKAVIANAEPNHLPQPEWWNDIEVIAADCERKGIPMTPGRRYKFKEISKNYNQVRW